MTYALWLALMGALPLAAQTAFPIILGRTPIIVPPAIAAPRGPVVFGSAVAPDGTTSPVIDLYLAGIDGSGLRRLTRLKANGATEVSLSADGSRAAFTASQEVHVVDIAAATDRTVAVDTQGCVQPLCANCFFTCVNTPHLSSDAATVLYSVRRSNPFYTVRTDGPGLTNLKIFTGVLAPGPQRVISRNGLVAFTSSAPFGPTFAASAQDVYLMNLDGTNIRALTRFGNDASVFSNNATISADGAAVAFEVNFDPATNRASNTPQIWLARASGNPAMLTSGTDAATSPSISADGSSVAFVRGGQIHIVRSDGTGLKRLTNFQMSTARDPVLSEDGSTVAFTVAPPDGGRSGAVYAVNSDGTNLRPVYAPRSLNQNGITAWGSFGPPSPGSVFSAYGTNLTSDEVFAAEGFPLPQSLGGISVLVNGAPAPLLAATPWQVNAQVPPEVAAAPATFQFRFADGTAAAAGTSDVSRFSPAIFSLSSGDVCQAAVLHANGMIADDAHPAAAGEAVEIYGTGLGPTDPLVGAGRPAPSSPPAKAAPPEVTIGGRTASVTFTGLAPGLAGVYQVNAIVPAGLQPGRQIVSWRIGDATSSGCGTMTVK